MPNTNTPRHWIHWDMGTYGPFASYDEARAYQREHAMTGSTVDTTP